MVKTLLLKPSEVFCCRSVTLNCELVFLGKVDTSTANGSPRREGLKLLKIPFFEQYEIADENGVRENLVLNAPAQNDAVLRAFDSRFPETDGRNRERSLQTLLLDVHSGPEGGIVGSDQLLGR